MIHTRAKLKVATVLSNGQSDVVQFVADYRGTAEDNTYSSATPNATLSLTVSNPALMDQFKPGQTYYVDLTPADQ